MNAAVNALKPHEIRACFTRSSSSRSARPRSSAGFARAILVRGGGRKKRAVRRATTAGRGAKPPSGSDRSPHGHPLGERQAAFLGGLGQLLREREADVLL